MTEWANKPDAIIHAELVTTEEELDEIFQFFLDNPIPRWHMHRETQAPHPSREELSFYLDRGNDIIVTRDQDGEMWAFSVRSRKDGRVLWIWARREARQTHEVLPDGTDGLTRNARLSIAHMHALSWSRNGIHEFVVPDDNTVASKVDQLDKVTDNPDSIPALTQRIYQELYESDEGGGDG